MICDVHKYDQSWVEKCAICEIHRLKAIIDSGRRGMGIDELELCLGQSNEDIATFQEACEWILERLGGFAPGSWENQLASVFREKIKGVL